MKPLLSLLLVLLLHYQVVAQSDARYVKAATLNLRKDASTSSEVITRLSRNSKVYVVSTQGEWAFVQTENQESGYVNTSYLSTTYSGTTTSYSPTSATRSPAPPRKKESTVLICTSINAYAYHSSYCHGLNRCRSGVSEVTVSEASSYGYQPCKICY